MFGRRKARDGPFQKGGLIEGKVDRPDVAAATGTGRDRFMLPCCNWLRIRCRSLAVSVPKSSCVARSLIGSAQLNT